jgi:hypothetical protein
VENDKVHLPVNGPKLLVSNAYSTYVNCCQLLSTGVTHTLLCAMAAWLKHLCLLKFQLALSPFPSFMPDLALNHPSLQRLAYLGLEDVRKQQL